MGLQAHEHRQTKEMLQPRAFSLMPPRCVCSTKAPTCLATAVTAEHIGARGAFPASG
jgi:hypothetical protein